MALHWHPKYRVDRRRKISGRTQYNVQIGISGRVQSEKNFEDNLAEIVSDDFWNSEVYSGQFGEKGKSVVCYAMNIKTEFLMDYIVGDISLTVVVNGHW